MRRRSRITGLLVGAGSSIFIMGVCILIGAFFGILKIRIDRSDCDDVLEGFAKSMRENKAEAAKSLAVPEQWDRIDAWMASREKIICAFSWDPDDNWSWLVGAACLDREDAECIEFGSICYHNGKVYHFSIRNAVLQKESGRCTVIGWDEICESHDGDKAARCQ